MIGTPTNLANKISTTSFNSRDAADLEPFAVFQGNSEDVSKYGRAGISVSSDNKSNGSVCIEVSHDGTKWGGPERTFENTQIAEPHMWNIVEKYFRIKYTNGTKKAINLSIQVQYSNNSEISLGRQVNETIIDETEGTVSRSILFGQDETGRYQNVPTDLQGRLKVQQDENEAIRVLKDVLKELKIMNEYNALMHETTITKEGV